MTHDKCGDGENTLEDHLTESGAVARKALQRRSRRGCLLQNEFELAR